MGKTIAFTTLVMAVLSGSWVVHTVGQRVNVGDNKNSVVIEAELTAHVTCNVFPLFSDGG